MVGFQFVFGDFQLLLKAENLKNSPKIFAS